MKRINSMNGLLIFWQLLSCSTLIAITILTISEITKMEIPEISDRDMIDWLVEKN
ncbi:hypothetical protein IQ255_28225 [Pleurocapsales cyanobacterium LEGE 10410]|nr:hypothetical protein [Pleurocapsales cyanobacterium LEGE 10410]